MRLDYFLKGIIIGIGKIIPGLSGSVIMISFGLYDKAIDAITNFFVDIKRNVLFLFNIGIGIILGIVMFSKILDYFITNYYLYTLSLFIGLILGSIPLVYKDSLRNKKGYILVFISFIMMLFINSIGGSNNYIVKKNYVDVLMFFISGIIEAIGTIIPGVSSTALLMLVGIYNIYLDILGNILNIYNIINTIWFLVPFMMGLVIGIILLSRLIDYLFKNFKGETFSLILGIIMASNIILIGRLLSNYHSASDIVISIILLLFGFYITKKV